MFFAPFSGVIGCSFFRCKMGVVDSVERASHQLVGTTGDSSGTETLYPVLAGKTCVSQNGRHNSGVIYRQGRTRSLPLSQLARTLFILCGEHLASLKAVHVLGHLNGGADLLSRGGPQFRECRLHLWIVEHIWDFFASAENMHCPPFSRSRTGAPHWGLTLCLMYGPGPCCARSHWWN